MGTPIATVLLSGGIDSAACVRLLQEQGHDVRSVFVDYGQAAAAPERRVVERLAEHLGTQLTLVEARGLTRFSTGELIGRNAFLIFSAVLLSRCHSGLLAMGIHAGTPYYDCSPAFVDSIARSLAEHTDGALQLVAPFLHWSKRQVFEYFVSVGLNIGLTYSCEAGEEPPCGQCASCRDRKLLECR